MGLAPLATPQDVAAIGYEGSTTGIDRFLDAASSAVRDAAGSPISQITSTVKVTGRPGDAYLRLPGPPVTSVGSVLVDGIEVPSDRYILDGDRVRKVGGWGGTLGTSTVTVTYTHGLAEVPADIKDLVCRMVIAALVAGADGGDALAINNGGQQSWSIDGFAEAFATSGDAVEALTEMSLPERTRRMLRSRFGGGAAVVTSR